MDLPDEIITDNRQNVDKIEALCILLKRSAYPCRYGGLVQRFGRTVPELCNITKTVMDMIYTYHGHLLTNLNQPWLSPANLQMFANAIHNKGAALDNCWGFVDGTVRPICRPNKSQCVLYNGHKRVHSLKFQSVVAPNGLIANLFGPVEGKRHDAAMLNQSVLLQQLQQFSISPGGWPLCIYGYPAHPLRVHLQGLFKGARITPLEAESNKSTSAVRIAVEWIFADIINYFAFLDFKKNLKIGLSAIEKMYIVCITEEFTQHTIQFNNI